LYGPGSEEDENGWHFQGLINHRLAIKQAEKASAGMDSALANLKSSLATLSQEKEARR
jgi:RNA polymerase II elongation factor ELL